MMLATGALASGLLALPPSGGSIEPRAIFKTSSSPKAGLSEREVEGSQEASPNTPGNSAR
jgi:hypothetical protein